MTEHKILFVQYCAKDFLDGTQNMDAITELAYRRICDMIYSTNDNLLDNDSLQYATKTGAKWKRIRKELIEVHKKIYIENGFIRNMKCTEKIEDSRKNIEQKRAAGLAAAEARKALKDNETGSTADGTADPTAGPSNRKPKTKVEEKEDTNVSSKNVVVAQKTHAADFVGWYLRYPHKIGRKAAEKAYAAAIRKSTPEELLDGLDRYIAGKPPDRPWCNPATWLNQERWLDQPDETPKEKTNEKTRRNFGYDPNEAMRLALADTTNQPDRAGGDPNHRQAFAALPRPTD
jgi:hypothetical protein